MALYLIELTQKPFVTALACAAVLDTFLGVLRAFKEHCFNSTAGINGGIRTAAMLVSVAFLALADYSLSFNLLCFIPSEISQSIGLKRIGLCDFFALFFCLYESASILKNMLKCGLPVPTRLRETIEKLLEKMTDELK